MAIDTSLNFRFGDIALLDYGPDAWQRHRVVLLGGLPGKSLLVTAPQAGGAMIPVDVGATVEARVLNGDAAQTFRASVLLVCREPYDYLHLSYPERVEPQQARSVPRVALGLVATVKPETDFELPGDRGSPAVIRDLSTSGAKLESSRVPGEVGAKLLVLTSFTFEGGANHPVVLPAEVRYVRPFAAEDGGMNYAFGVRFFDLPLAAEHALAAFVYRHLISRLLREPA